MMWEALFSALALVFILEGILPFLSPSLWRRALQAMLLQTDVSIRCMGLFSMLVGVVVLYGLRKVAGE